jgi:GAG-pre-integrase domain
MFGKNYSSLSIDDIVFARGSKINNIFAYETITSIIPYEQAKSLTEPSEATIWHHRLAHASYPVIDKMSRSKTVIGLPPNMSFGPTTQCINCPFGKQVRTMFQKIEALPSNIGDTIVSDVCGPFESSIGGFKYFVIWIDDKRVISYLYTIQNSTKCIGRTMYVVCTV